MDRFYAEQVAAMLADCSNVMARVHVVRDVIEVNTGHRPRPNAALSLAQLPDSELVGKICAPAAFVAGEVDGDGRVPVVRVQDGAVVAWAEQAFSSTLLAALNS